MGKSAAVELVAIDPSDDTVDAPVSAATPLPALVIAPAPKPGWPLLAALAITAGIAAIGLGAWAVVSETRSTAEETTAPTVDWSLAVLADSDAERYPLRNTVRRITLVVDPGGRAVLTLDGLGRAPAGSVYEAWLVPPGSAAASPVAMFDGSARVIPLSQRVQPGGRVGVTLEAAGGVGRPTKTLRLVALRPG